MNARPRLLPHVLIALFALANRPAWSDEPSADERSSLLRPVQQAEQPVKVGIVGLDSYHAVAFTQLFHMPAASENNPDLAGVRVVAAVPAGSPDIAESVENLPKWVEQIQPYGVEIVDSIDALLPMVDAVLITGADGRAHLAQARPVIAARKPLFIDRPLAASLADAVTIFHLAESTGTPIFSCSQHRFQPGFIGMRKHEEVGDVLGAEVYGGVKYEPHHPDLFWNGVHGVETLYTIMGPDCVSVTRAHTEGCDLVTGVWGDGRVGTYRAIRQGAVAYSALVFGSKGIVAAGRYGEAHAPVNGATAPGRYMGYEAVAVEIAKFVKTAQPPVSADETLEIFAFLEAAEESRRRDGQPVRIDEMLEQARKANGF